MSLFFFRAQSFALSAGYIRKLQLVALNFIVITLVACANQPGKGLPPNQTALNQAAGQNKARHIASLQAIHDFTLDGRIGVQTEGRGFSGKMRWQHLNQENSIDLFSPLGAKVAAIESTTEGVTLTTGNNSTVSSNDIESLTEQTMGWRLPAQYLEDWVLGRAANAPVTNADWDESGKLVKLNQEGWEVEYLAYQESNGLQLPSKLNVRNAKLYLKLIIDRWLIKDQSAPASPDLPVTQP